MYSNQEIETMPRELMTQLQTERLRKTMKWAYEKSPFYHEKMNSLGLTDQSIQTLDDLKKMPFTTQNDLIENSPFGFLTVPISGTIRMRIVGRNFNIARAYTNADVGRNVEMMTRCLMAGGVTKGTIMEVIDEYSDENALSVQYAAEVLGATVVPSPLTNLERAITMMNQFGVDAIVSNPKQLLQLIINAQAFENDIKGMPLTAIFCMNDLLRNNMDTHLKSRIGAKIYNMYSPVEFGCAGMLFECEHKCGFHIQEDYFYPEVVRLGDNQAIDENHMGELVITSLALEAMPLLRFRTGQMVMIDQAPCKCGRTLLRLKTP